MAATITLDLHKTAKGYSLPRSEHHYDRAAIMRDAHIRKHELRAATALATFKAETKLDALNRPWHPRTLAEVTKATPIDFRAAMLASWANARKTEAKRARKAARKFGRALALTSAGALATIREFDLSRLLAGVAAVVKWLDQRFLAPRQHGAALPVINRIQ